MDRVLTASLVNGMYGHSLARSAEIGPEKGALHVVPSPAEEPTMSDREANSDEGASPAEDIKKQNPEGTTTGDQTGEASDKHKVEDLAKAGRSDMDPNRGAD